MDRSLVLKAKALAKGTQKIDLSILSDEYDDANVIDAEFVDVPNEPEPEEVIVLLEPKAVEAARVTPGRARRATDAYTAEPVSRRPIISIG
ncbi:MAG: hypothetical protein QM831_02960 [Kofleriaceae bacterium]